MLALRKCCNLSATLARGAATPLLASVRSPAAIFRRPNSFSSSSTVEDSLLDGSPVADRDFSSPAAWDEVGEATDANTAAIISKDVLVYKDFVTEEEEKSLFDEVEPYLKRLRYEENHWDDAILGYRETERKTWSQKNKIIVDRMKKFAFEPGAILLPYVHVLDLKESGVIKAHVDSVKFCGSTISGICLLSSAVMRFVNEKEKSRYADVLLSRRCLYIMRNRVRYEYTHEVLGGDSSKFKNAVVQKGRRIAILARNEPVLTDDVS